MHVEALQNTLLLKEQLSLSHFSQDYNFAMFNTKGLACIILDPYIGNISSTCANLITYRRTRRPQQSLWTRGAYWSSCARLTRRPWLTSRTSVALWSRRTLAAWDTRRTGKSWKPSGADESSWTLSMTVPETTLSDKSLQPFPGNTPHELVGREKLVSILH